MKKLIILAILVAITACGGGKFGDPNPNAVPENFSRYLTSRIATDPIKSHFLYGYADGLNASIPVGFRMSIDQQVGRRGADENNPDGFAYFAIEPNGGGEQYFYAGILSGTDLGLPLNAQPANANWAGHISFHAQDGANLTNQAITFDVNFAEGTFTSNPLPDITLMVNGVFGEHINASGLARGEMGGFVILDANDPTTTASLIGLIGVQGAVGAFNSGTFAGGFTATNP
ncbi:MAG: hypothetical protein K8953_06760 [Proteobacteria bacterium]|nr:hypothetical protein [Pseudomonadota bacterium]